MSDNYQSCIQPLTFINQLIGNEDPNGCLIFLPEVHMESHKTLLVTLYKVTFPCTYIYISKKCGATTKCHNELKYANLINSCVQLADVNFLLFSCLSCVQETA